MNDRIKELRKTLKLTQREFAGRLGIKPCTIAHYETGRNNPIDAVVSLICREFNVSEEWLRTGKGDMFQKSQAELIVEKYGLEPAATEVVNAILQMPPYAQKFAIRFIEEFTPLYVEQKKRLKRKASKARKPPEEWTREDYHAAVDEQLDAEEKGEDVS